MSIMSFPKEAFSPTAVWMAIEKRYLSHTGIILLLILPFALLPAVMLYYAGTHYGDAMMTGFGNKPWERIALLFFLLELLSFAGMFVLVRSIVNTYDIRMASHHILLLVAISTIPLLLSSLVLVTASLFISVMAVAIALGCTCWLLYHGVRVLGNVS